MTTALLLAAAHHIKGPHIDWRAVSPIVALTAGGLVALMVGLINVRFIRDRVVPALAILAFACTIAAAVWRFHHPASVVSGALRIDDLALELYILFSLAGIATIVLSLRGIAPRESGHGEHSGLILFSVLGMAVFASAQNLVTLFLGIELLSIPLYVLCASETRREGSLESGLKYLVVGSVGSATLVYGLALVYGATGSTDFTTIGAAMSQGKLAGGVLGNPMVLTGLGLTIVGFAFKASIAPFHQWTPDVYEGAPTPITAFMATATKAAALGAFLRFFDVAAIGAQDTWAPLLATLATITIIVGNVGALGQTSLKRMMGYSGVAQAGYMLAGVIVASRLGIQATMLYLMAYLFMNMAPFAVIVGEERERPDGDYLTGLSGLGARKPWLAWPMTIGMLGLAGIPGTIGFIGKFQLISALVSGAYTWLAIVLVVGSMISLGYYLRVIATMWMGPALPAPVPAGAGGAEPYAPIAGASPEADGSGGAAEGDGSDGAATDGPASPGPAAGGAPDLPEPAYAPAAHPFAQPEVLLVAVVFAAATIFFGVFPSPLFHAASHAANALAGLF